MEARKGRKSLVIIVLVAAVILTGIYLYYSEGTEPAITLSPRGKYINPSTKFSLHLQDAQSGLASVRITAKQGKDEKLLLKKDFSGTEKRWESYFTLSEGFEDGEVQISILARDRSWNNLWKGNLARSSVSYYLDSEPPQISMDSFRHNLNQGGSGLAVFNVSEPVEKVGIKIKDYFFPAYRQSSSRYLCLFSFPYNVSPDKGRPVVMAVDRAGNSRQTGFHYYVNSRSFPKVQSRISPKFLQRKMPQFQNEFSEKNDLQLFLKVNRELRGRNRQKLLEIGRQTSTEALWSDKFLRQPQAARKASFGVRRIYTYNGREIDQQTHLGVDLASLARAPVSASNAGKVVYSDWLGIYGQTVIIDHGIGLQTLYGHLSQRKVKKGESVDKGQVIGRTGATGLAGGDHLHFAILVSGVAVNPVEWWDQSWIQNNIKPKLAKGTDQVQ